MKSSPSKFQQKKKYKALVLDIDGTIIKNNFNAMPSKKVKNAIKKAHGKIIVILATSRPFIHTTHIIENLNISYPCIFMGGSQIFDPKLNKMLWEKLIDIEDVKKIFKIIKKLNIEITDDGTNKPQRNEKVNLNEYIDKGPAQFWIYALTLEEALNLAKNLSHIPTISVVKVPSWEKGKTGIVITHAKANKKHALQVTAKTLGISTTDMIAIGDGHNDIPLLMACGLKIAMGNANEELKKIADFVAPSVEEDGVATVIEKFIL